MHSKPKLVYFQWDHSKLPAFLQSHMELHVKCLSEFFEVVLINYDCDYQQICDKYQPDLALFESGFRSSFSRRPNVKNTFTHSNVVKLGLHNGDPWCECRTGFISDMANWGINTYFTISTTTAENTPDISENLFVWPNFIDSETFYDYGLEKNVPILFTGRISSLYPWRQSIYNKISNFYPSITFPHLGYESYSPIMIHGIEYARSINSSKFVPTCGTLAKEVVRKHFEIPAAKSCLITERSNSIQSAGFIDMENCVFADEDDILDKIQYLLLNKDVLENITNSGYNLVHTSHTYKQRNQIYQWYLLSKQIESNQKIVQLDPFGPLQIFDKREKIHSIIIKSNAKHIDLLEKGDAKLWSGQFDDAEFYYLQCLDYIHWLCEPKVKLAVCNLFKGKPSLAYNWVKEPLVNNLRDYRAFDCDPVEWAYLIISLLCMGNLKEATIRSLQFPSLTHPELDRTRLVINCLNNVNVSFNENSSIKPRASIHQFPTLSIEDWVIYICKIFDSCKQYEFSEILRQNVILKVDSFYNCSEGRLTRIKNNRFIWLSKIDLIFRKFNINNIRPELPPINEIDYLIILARYLKLDYIKKVYSFFFNT